MSDFNIPWTCLRSYVDKTIWVIMKYHYIDVLNQTWDHYYELEPATVIEIINKRLVLKADAGHIMNGTDPYILLDCRRKAKILMSELNKRSEKNMQLIDIIKKSNKIYKRRKDYDTDT